MRFPPLLQLRTQSHKSAFERSFYVIVVTWNGNSPSATRLSSQIKLNEIYVHFISRSTGQNRYNSVYDMASRKNMQVLQELRNYKLLENNLAYLQPQMSSMHHTFRPYTKTVIYRKGIEITGAGTQHIFRLSLG